MALNEQEKYFLASIVDKIKTYQIATNLKEAFSRRSGIFATTTYNNGEEEIVDTGIEIFLASKSFYYWLHKYAIVEIPGSGNFPMEPYHFQTEFAKEIEQYRKIVTLKTRQAGISTFSSFYCLWRCTFKKSENIDVVSTKQLKAQQFVKKMKPTMKAMPEWMKPKVKNENTQMIVWEFPDGATSQILSESQSENAGRGDSLSLLVLDEVAFYQSDKMVRTIISSAQPTLTKTGGQLLLISCVKKDTYIYTDKGLQQVQDFIPDNCKPGYNKIPEFKIDGINHKQISSTFYDSGITPTKKIHLQNGIVNEISEIHPFYVIDETSPFPYFKQTKDIKAGDYSLASCREKTFGNNDYFNFEYKFESHRDKYNIQNFDNAITEDMSYFFGLLIGDGFIDFSNQCCIITSNDEETQNWLLNNPHFNCVREIRKDDDIHFRLQGKYLITLLKKLGFTKQKAKNKIIPKRLLQLSRKNTAALLRGLFDSDGHSRTRDGSIGFTSTSEELLKQVKLLLDMFGIQISDERWNYIDPKKSTRVNVVSHVGQITMSRYFSKIFYEKIGFNIKRKQEKYESVKHIEYSSSQSYPDIKFWIRDNLINKYVDKTLQKNLSTDKRKDWEHPSRILRYESNDKTTRNNIKKILDYYDGILNDKEEYQRLLDFYNKDWYLLEVKKIENGKEHTYDFVIPETRSFYANGVIGSNTPNGISGSGAYYYEQIQAILTTKPKDSKLVQIDWWMIPDDPMIKGSKKGFNKILENAITEDYYNNPAILKKYRDIFEPIAREPKLNPWLKAQLEDLQDVKYKQEILHEFILSGNKVFNEEELERVFNRIKEPVEKDRFKGRQVDGLWFWKTPKEGKRYIISADISKGTSNDYSSFQVFDVEDYEQVCEYKNLISTPAFSALIKDVARYYNEAYCVIESNGVGEAVFTKLYYDEYDPYGNLYKEFKKNKKGETIATGWTTTQASRLLITNTLIDWIKVEELFSTIKIYSSRTYNEMTTWIYGSGGRPIHVDGANDDLLISLALSLYNRHRAVNSGQSFLIAEDGKVLSYENSKNEEVEKGMFGLITSDNDTDDEGFTKEMADAYNWLISG